MDQKPQNNVDLVLTPFLTRHVSKSRLGSVTIESSLARGANNATLKSYERHYISEPVFRASYPFSLETTMITSGRFKGHEAIVLVPVPTEHFLLLSLPPEIRNMIYKHLLTKDNCDITISGVKKESLRGTWTKKKTFLNGGVYGRVVHPHTNFLQICQQVYSEAVNILYACNTFRLRNMTAMQNFLTTIGSRRKQIRRISLFDITDENFKLNLARRGTVLLAEACQLERVKIECKKLSDNSATDVVMSFIPVFKMLIARGLKKAELSKVVSLGRPRYCSKHMYNGQYLEADCNECIRRKRFFSHAFARLKRDLYKALDEPED